MLSFLVKFAISCFLAFWAVYARGSLGPNLFGGFAAPCAVALTWILAGLGKPKLGEIPQNSVSIVAPRPAFFESPNYPFEGALVTTESLERLCREIDVNYAELNRRQWSGKRKTNWHIESAWEELQRDRSNQRDQALILLNASLDAIADPRLNNAEANEALRLKQSFFLSLSSGIKEWQSGKPKPDPQPSSTSGQSAFRASGQNGGLQQRRRCE